MQRSAVVFMKFLFISADSFLNQHSELLQPTLCGICLLFGRCEDGMGMDTLGECGQGQGIGSADSIGKYLHIPA